MALQVRFPTPPHPTPSFPIHLTPLHFSPPHHILPILPNTFLPTPPHPAPHSTSAPPHPAPLYPILPHSFFPTPPHPSPLHPTPPHSTPTPCIHLCRWARLRARSAQRHILKSSSMMQLLEQTRQQAFMEGRADTSAETRQKRRLEDRKGRAQAGTWARPDAKFSLAPPAGPSAVKPSTAPAGSIPWPAPAAENRNQGGGRIPMRSAQPAQATAQPTASATAFASQKWGTTAKKIGHVVTGFPRLFHQEGGREI